MAHISERTRQELISELQHLQVRLEQMSEGSSEGAFNEQDLRALVPEVVGDELFLVTDTGRIVYTSASMAESLGFESDELQRMSMTDLDPGITRAAWLHLVSSIKKSRSVNTFETRHEASDGSFIAKEIAASHITYKGRTYVLCVARIISVEDVPQSPVPTGSTRESAILTAVNDGVVIVDTKGVIVDTNVAADRLLGLPKSEIIGRSIVDPRWRFVDMRGNQVKISDHPVTVALVEEMPVVNKRIAMTQSDGTQRILLVNAAPIFDSAKVLIGAAASLRIHNMSEENHEYARRASRLLTLHRDISAAVAVADSINALERKVCDTLVAGGDYALVWIGTIKPNDFKVHASTWAGEASDFLLKIRVRWDEGEYGISPVGQAVRTRALQVVSDMQEDPRMHLWKRQTERASLYSMASLPIIANGEVVAVLSLYARDRNHFLDGELSLLSEIAGIYAFGVEGIINRDARRGIETEARRHAATLDAIRDRSATAYCLFDTRAPYTSLEANRAYCNMLDLPFRKSGIKGSFLSDYIHTHMHRDLYDRIDEAASGEDLSATHDAVFTAPDGTMCEWTWSIIPIRHSENDIELLYVASPVQSTVSSAMQSAVHTAVTQPDTARVNEGTMPRTRQSAPVASSAANAPALSESESPLDTICEGLLCVTFPTPAARSRREKRIEQFFADGRITLANGVARRLIGADAIAADTAPATVIAQDCALGEAICTLLTGRDASVVADTPSGVIAAALSVLDCGDGTSRAWITMLPANT